MLSCVLTCPSSALLASRYCGAAPLCCASRFAVPPKFAGAVNLHEVQAAEARLRRNSFALAGDNCSRSAACLGPSRGISAEIVLRVVGRPPERGAHL